MLNLTNPAGWITLIGAGIGIAEYEFLKFGDTSTFTNG